MTPPIPRLGPRLRTDPSLTLAKLADVVDPRSGIVTDVARWSAPGSRVVGFAAGLETASLLGDSMLSRLRGTTEEIWRTGRQGREGTRVAFDPTRAFVRAVGEALERYACGLYDPSGFVTATWEDLKERALDPRALQRPTADEYARRPRLAPFDPRARMRWTWGWDLRDGRALLVPAQLCWVTYNLVAGEPRMTSPTSTGWALHHTREEAIHTALREVIERDSFFVHWLARMTPPRLDLASVELPDVRGFVDEVRADGAEPHVLVTTTDVGVPSFAVALVDRREGRPAFQLTLAAHPDPRRALRQAVEEAAMMRVSAAMREETPPPPARMEDIELMSDHAEFYLHQRNLGPVEWLLSGPEVPFSALPDLSSDDVWEEIRRMVSRLDAAGMGTLYVDTTPPDLRQAGWETAKVIVPGSVRHEYGHGNLSLDCPRVFEAPVRMGRRAARLASDEVNRDAHPYS